MSSNVGFNQLRNCLHRKGRLSSRVEALRVLEGALLSDAGLFRQPRSDNAYFYIGLSGASHVDWLCHIKEALELFNIDIGPQYPRIFSRVNYSGKLVENCHLQTRVSSFLTALHYRWYPDGVKIVPPDLLITSRTLANMFMGDGSSSLRNDYSVPTSCVRLSVPGFDLPSVQTLERQLELMGLRTGRSHSRNIKKGAGITISIHNESVNKFMSKVEPFIFPSYSYKVKRNGIEAAREISAG